MALSPLFLDELRLRVPLSSLVGRKLKLTRAGREWKAPCPFHKEKTPSFYVNDDKGFFHCFGCGAHGDLIGFVMRYDNASFIEAVESLAAEAGLEVPKSSPMEQQKAVKQKTLYEVLEAATLWFEAALRTGAGHQALAYLRERGLDDDAIAAFRLGYAPGDGQALLAALKSQGINDADLLEVGLIRKSEDGRLYSFFRDRIIFPVGDRRGRTIAFGARLIQGEGPKYINSPEHTLFHKGDVLYGMARARQAAATGQNVIVTEGYMDVIALVRAGFAGAVAPMGTALTEQQIETLWRLAPGLGTTPILCLDGDTAGRRAAGRAVERVLPLLKPDQSLSIAFLPEDQDPDSLLRQQGRQAFEAILTAALPLVDVIWQNALAAKPVRTPEQRAGLKAHLTQQIEQIADRAVRDQYRNDLLRRFSESFGFQPRSFLRNGKKPVAAIKPMQRPGSRQTLHTQVLLATMLNHPFLFEEFSESFLSLPLSDDLTTLHKAICVVLNESESLDGKSLQCHLIDRGFQEQITALMSPRVFLHAGFARQDSERHTVREGWLDIISRGQQAEMLAELKQAAGELAQDMNDTNFKKLCALRGEAQRTQNEFDSEIDNADKLK